MNVSVDKLLEFLINGLVTIAISSFGFWDVNNSKPSKTDKKKTQEDMLRGWVTVIIALPIIYMVIKLIHLIILQLRVNIFNGLAQFSKDNSFLKSKLIPVYNQILADLSENRRYPMNHIEVFFTSLLLFISSPLFLKFLSGAGMGIILIFWTFFAKRKKKERNQAFRGAVLVTLVFGIIGVFIPFFPQIPIGLNWFINFFVLLIIQFILLIYIGNKQLSAT